MTVDLTPECVWWTNALHHMARRDGLSGQSPMPKVFRIAGEIVRQYGQSWVIEAEVGNSPTNWQRKTILLKEPPAAEHERFLELFSLIAEAKQSGEDASDVKVQSPVHMQVFGTVQPSLEEQNRAKQAQYESALRQIREGKGYAEQTASELQSELRKIPHWGTNEYKVDILCVKLPGVDPYVGYEIYDCGEFLP